MADFSGRLVNYGLALETVRGTAVNPGTGGFWIRWETADFADTATTVLNQSVLNTLDKFSGAEVTEKWATGQIAGKITDHAIGLILYSVFGGYAVQAHAGETVVFDHTFTEDQLNAGPTLTITRQDPNVTNQYTKGTVNSFSLDVKAGDFVRHTTTMMANPTVNTTTKTVLYTAAEQEFTAKHCIVQFNYGAAIPLASLKLDITNSAENYWILGQTSPGDIFQKTFEVKGEMTLRYSDQTYYNLRFNNTAQTVYITIQNTDVVLGIGTPPTLTFLMPACYLNDWKVDQSIDGMVQQTIGFEATYSISNGYAIRAVLTNKHTVYSAAGVS